MCVFYFGGLGGFVVVVCFVLVIRLLHSDAVCCCMAAGKCYFIFIMYDKKVKIGTRSTAFYPYYILLMFQPPKLAKKPRRYRRHRVKFFQLSAKAVRNFGAGMGTMGKWHERTKGVS